MSTITTTQVDQVGGEAATAQQEAVDKRRGSRAPRTGGKSIAKAEPKQRSAVAAAQQILSVTFDELLAMSTVLVAASTDDVTPIITHVRVRQAADRIEAVGTDRFRVAMVDFPRRDASRGEFEVVLSRDILNKAIAVGKIGGDHKEMQDLATVAITVEQIGTIQHTTLESVRGWRFSEDAPQGVYPPIDRLFPADDAVVATLVGTTLNMKFVADAAKVRVPGQVNPAQTDNMWSVGQVQSENPSRPGPVLFTQTGLTGRARYLLQPSAAIR